MRTLVSSVVVAALSLPAFAQPNAAALALLTQISGGVLVDAGEGFTAVSEDVRLKLGDRVMVTKGGEAVLSYGGDCSFPLQAPSMTTIEPTACLTTTQEGTGGNGGDGGTALMTGASILGPLALIGAAIANDEESPVSP
jgi:hypothetical protein